MRGVELDLGRETDPELSAHGGWVASQYVNTLSKRRILPPAEEIVRSIHRRVVWYTVLPEFRERQAGEYRYNDIVAVIGSGIEVPPSLKVPKLMNTYGKEVDMRLAALLFDKKSIRGILNTQSYAHYELAKIHPFFDGTGRTARHFIRLIGKRCGLRAPVIGPIHRKAYLASLERVDQTGKLEYFTAFLATLTLSEYERGKEDEEFVALAISRHLTDTISAIGPEGRKFFRELERAGRDW